MAALLAFPADRWTMIPEPTPERAPVVLPSFVAPMAPAVALVHVRVWSGSRTGRVTEMANAGKVGKVCRAIRVAGSSYDGGPSAPPAEQATARASWDLMRTLEQLDPATPYDRVLADLRHIMQTAAAAGAYTDRLHVIEETIKGIHAPRPLLTAGVAGLWSASADESGISMSALNDVNEWREITHRQTRAAAYAIAARVWPQVQAAPTLHAAAAILTGAGARLHGYCGMD